VEVKNRDINVLVVIGIKLFLKYIIYYILP